MSRNHPLRTTSCGPYTWVLEQRSVWVDKHGVVHRIHDMDEDYVQNVHDFLLRYTEDFVAMYADWRGMPAHVTDGERAEKWLQETPLLRVLRARLAYQDQVRERRRQALRPVGEARSLVHVLHTRRGLRNALPSDMLSSAH